MKYMGNEKKGFGYKTSSPDRYSLLKDFAKSNRKNMTDAEIILWQYLRRLPSTFHFRRQHVIVDYIADFVCLERRLVIEVDGGYHSQPLQIESDEYRTLRLTKIGFSVLRFTNEQIICDIDEVMETINKVLYND